MPICGDSFCDPPEDPQTCPQDCQMATTGTGGGGSTTCAHDVCVQGGPLDPLCDPCVTIICGLDSYCCDTAWDDSCTLDADFFCGCP